MIATVQTMPQQGRNPSSKVERVIGKYDLDGLGKELERRWLANDGESLRELADRFNRRVLAAALESASIRGGFELNSIYERLTASDVSAGKRKEVERELDRAGIDVDEVQGSFVSHQTIHTYLTTHRNVSYPDTTPDERVSSVKETVNRLQSRLSAVTESNVRRLVDSDELRDGSYEILISVEILCEDCGTLRPFGEFLRAGGCPCSARASNE